MSTCGQIKLTTHFGPTAEVDTPKHEYFQFGFSVENSFQWCGYNLFENSQEMQKIFHYINARIHPSESLQNCMDLKKDLTKLLNF